MCPLPDYVLVNVLILLYGAADGGLRDAYSTQVYFQQKSAPARAVLSRLVIKYHAACLTIAAHNARRVCNCLKSVACSVFMT